MIMMYIHIYIHVVSLEETDNPNMLAETLLPVFFAVVLLTSLCRLRWRKRKSPELRSFQCSKHCLVEKKMEMMVERPITLLFSNGKFSGASC